MIKHGVFINQKNSHCSIYEAGLSINNILRGISNEFLKEYTIDYYEMDANLTGFNWHPYDFYIINWHHITLPIQAHLINKMKGKKFAIVLEVTPNNCFPYIPDWFDAYMVIDSTKIREGKIYPFCRPLEIVSDLRPLLSTDKTVIGGFGFVCPQGPALVYKRFFELVENANKIGNCIVRLNFPVGTFTGIPLQHLIDYGNILRKLAKPDVEVIVTHDYMSRSDLVRWCSENTINSYPYYRDLPGVSAVTDQAISAGRPIAITNCVTFRHMHQYISWYPNQSYLELIESTPSGIKQMQIDWHADKFREKFRQLLVESGVI